MYPESFGEEGDGGTDGTPICFQFSSRCLSGRGSWPGFTWPGSFLASGQAFLAVSLLIGALHAILLCCIDALAFEFIVSFLGFILDRFAISPSGKCCSILCRVV